MSKTAREVIAEYNFERDVGDHNLEFSLWDEDADAIIAALDAAGFVIMPKEPTEAMIDAGSSAKFESTERGNSNTVSAYRAMITAAQEPQS